VESPVPALADRRATVWESLGGTPLLFRDQIPHKRRIRTAGIATVYVDVSGSTQEFWAILAAAVRPFAEKKLIRLFAFREIVDEITPQKLARGRFKATNGTDAICIWEHALKNKFAKLLILTDGYVGRQPEEWLRRLKEHDMLIRVALTPDGFLNDLENVAAEIVELPL